MKFLLVVLMSGVLLISCSHGPYFAAEKSYKTQVKAFADTLRALPDDRGIDSIRYPDTVVRTVNFGLRKPNFVILHHTAQHSCPETLRTFTRVSSKVSAHYLICKDGTVHHLLNDYLRAWQAGVSKWGNVTDVNSVSVGIEIDNDGFEPFTDAQIGSLLHVLQRLRKEYGIPQANFVGHADIAPGRKVDPSSFFPWKLLASRGFGYWYDDTTGVAVPGGFNHLAALRMIGYDTRDSANAISSFHLHFLGKSGMKQLAEGDDKILYQLSKKY